MDGGVAMDTLDYPCELMLPANENKEETCLNEAERVAALLELASDDDLEGFRDTINADRSLIGKSGSWYGRQSGSKQMILVQRTPLMVAALYGSVEVLRYILSFVQSDGIDINQCCDPDGSSALHCAISGASPRAVEVVTLLLSAGADVNVRDKQQRRPEDVIPTAPKFADMKQSLKRLLHASSFPSIPAIKTSLSSSSSEPLADSSPSSPTPSSGASSTFSSQSSEGNNVECTVNAGKEYPTDPSLPDIKNAMYTTDEFRMFSFKIRPCSRAYSHDWTECPFVHPGENARRRDPRRFHYSCVPCPDFRKGSCRRGDACEYAHGVFECWLHPAQYRTRLCKDGTSCSRRVCFFAHLPEELRPLYTPNGCALPSPRSSAPIDMRSLTMSPDLPPPSPSSVLIMSPFSPSPGGSPSATLTPPMSPSAASAAVSHSNIWSNSGTSKTPPALQLSSGLHASRLRAALHARDMAAQEEMNSMIQAQDDYDELSICSSIDSLHIQVHPKPRMMTSLSMNGRAEINHVRTLSSQSFSSMQDFGDKEYFADSTLSPRASALRSPRASFLSSNHSHLDIVSPSHRRHHSDQLLQQFEISPSLGSSLNPQTNNSSSLLNSQSNIMQTQHSAVAAAIARRSLSSRSAWRERDTSHLLSTSNSLNGQTSMASNYSIMGKADWSMYQDDDKNYLPMDNNSNSVNASINNVNANGSQNGFEAEPDVSWVQSLVKDGGPDQHPPFSSSPFSSSPFSSSPIASPFPLGASLDFARLSLGSDTSNWS